MKNEPLVRQKHKEKKNIIMQTKDVGIEGEKQFNFILCNNVIIVFLSNLGQPAILKLHFLRMNCLL
jgi:hypothetical protein